MAHGSLVRFGASRTASILFAIELLYTSALVKCDRAYAHDYNYCACTGDKRWQFLMILKSPNYRIKTTTGYTAYLPTMITHLPGLGAYVFFQRFLKFDDRYLVHLPYFFHLLIGR